VLTTDSGCSKISFNMKESNEPFMISSISICKVVISLKINRNQITFLQEFKHSLKNWLYFDHYCTCRSVVRCFRRQTSSGTFGEVCEWTGDRRQILRQRRHPEKRRKCYYTLESHV
jgi:hypothetical protein